MTKGKFFPRVSDIYNKRIFFPPFCRNFDSQTNSWFIINDTRQIYVMAKMHKQLFNKVNFQHKVVSIDLNRQNICPIWRNGTKHSRYYWTDKNWGLIEKRMVDIGFQGQHAKMNTAITTGIQSARIGRLLNRISPWLDVIAYQSW